MISLGFRGEAGPHCTEVTGEEEEEKKEGEEEEEEGADRSQGREGLGRGKSFNPEAATGLWTPPPPALTGASWSWLRMRGLSVGIQGGGLLGLPGSAGRRVPRNFFPRLSPLPPSLAGM